MHSNVSAIILAGGKNTRMSGNEKSLLVVNNKYLIVNIIDQLNNLFPEILISTNTPEKYPFLKQRKILDITPGQGPLMGIFSGLLASNSEKNFIIATDIPCINIKLIEKMLDESDGYDLVIPESPIGQYEPLYAVYNKSILPAIKKLLDNNTRKIIKILDLIKYKTVEFHNNGWYQNLNNYEDYTKYISKL